MTKTMTRYQRLGLGTLVTHDVGLTVDEDGILYMVIGTYRWAKVGNGLEPCLGHDPVEADGTHAAYMLLSLSPVPEKRTSWFGDLDEGLLRPV